MAGLISAAPAEGDTPVERPQVQVIALVDRRRRAGLAFGPEPVAIDADQLDAPRFLSLALDPLLSVAIGSDAPDGGWRMIGREEAMALAGEYAAFATGAARQPQEPQPEEPQPQEPEPAKTGARGKAARKD